VVVVINDEVEVGVVIDVSNSENERGNLGPNCGAAGGGGQRWCVAALRRRTKKEKRKKN